MLVGHIKQKLNNSKDSKRRGEAPMWAPWWRLLLFDTKRNMGWNQTVLPVHPPEQASRECWESASTWFPEVKNPSTSKLKHFAIRSWNFPPTLEEIKVIPVRGSWELLRKCFSFLLLLWNASDSDWRYSREDYFQHAHLSHCNLQNPKNVLNVQFWGF